MNYAIALGGNIGKTEQIFTQALALIDARIGTVSKKSGWYETVPLLNPKTPIPDQRNYLNGVVLVHSNLAPQEVLSALLEIETTLGRMRDKDTPRWGPRTIDLDLIAGERLMITSSTLTLPHPEMHKRLFVLEPMLEVWPDWEHPSFKKTVQQLYDTLIASDR
jgi:2-amino-4-hydroxy-6-hydroxymethyldihydropteridine diphosphokinase